MSNLWITFGIIALLIAVTAAIVLSGPPIPEDEKIKAVRRALKIESVGLSDTIIKQCIAYKNREDQFSGMLEFASWDNDTDKLSNFVLFGIKLLEFCATYDSDLTENYPKIVTNMVEHLVARLEQVNPQKLEFEKAPWGNSKFTFFSHVTRFLAMYEYVGENDRLKLKCHDQLMLIVPTIGRSLQPVDVKNQEGMNLLYQAVPRLCSNYMFDREEWKRDLVNPNFLSLQNFMKFERVTQEKPPRDGVYLDDSWIVNGNVPSYSDLLRFYNYHERVYQALGFETPIREIAGSVLKKLMHPNIRFQPLGLVNNSGEVLNKRRYWDIEPSINGVHIMPFIGLGVFKTDQFLFHVRVQRPRIAAFEIDVDNDPKLGIGALMMRKIYLKGERYEGTLKWADLKEQPGMIVFEDDKIQSEECKTLEVENNYKIKSIFTRPDDIESFVGHLEDGKLMYWYNNYFFTTYGTFVTEMGVVTAKGVQVRTKIGNFSSYNLQFVWKDSNVQLSCHAEANAHKDNNDALTAVNVGDKMVTCVPKKFTIVRWKMMLNDSSDDYHVDFKSKMTFEYNNNKYEVHGIEKGRYYVKRNAVIVLGGSASSDPNDSFRVSDLDSKGYKFIRNPITMMYKAEKI